MKIAIAETGYICLSNAILLAQHNEAQEMESGHISQYNKHVTYNQKTKADRLLAPLCQSGEPVWAGSESVPPFGQRQGRCIAAGHPTAYSLRVKGRLGGIYKVS